MAKISVRFSEPVGPMKPMHGVNNGPLTCNFTCDARALFREAGIPYSRLHDTEYPFGSGEFVDVPCIFKDFERDPDDPTAYNFALTDLYLKAIEEAGTKIIYRLGVTIEHNPVKVHIWPPKDNLKWARICEHIIRHYNEGWADGFHMGIEYWEIWNEPNHCKDLKMWGGTAEEFAELYATAAEHLKKCFPDCRIGGPAFSSPDSEFVQNFFRALTKDGRRPPMDFYSWHGYVDTIEKAVERSRMAERVLAQYGYTGAEHIYDEYNYVKTWSDMGVNVAVIQNLPGAAFTAAMMAAMQNTCVSKLCYYDAQMKMAGSWCGLFERGRGKRVNGGMNGLTPRKPYFAFKAFNEVYKCGTQRALESDDDRLYAVAAYDGTQGALLISSYADPDECPEVKEVSVSVEGLAGKTASVYVLDESTSLEKVASFPAGDFSWQMKPYTVLLIRFA